MCLCARFFTMSCINHKSDIFWKRLCITYDFLHLLVTNSIEVSLRSHLSSRTVSLFPHFLQSTSLLPLINVVPTFSIRSVLSLFYFPCARAFKILQQNLCFYSFMHRRIIFHITICKAWTHELTSFKSGLYSIPDIQNGTFSSAVLKQHFSLSSVSRDSSNFPCKCDIAYLHPETSHFRKRVSHNPLFLEHLNNFQQSGSFCFSEHHAFQIIRST